MEDLTSKIFDGLFVVLGAGVALIGTWTIERLQRRQRAAYLAMRTYIVLFEYIKETAVTLTTRPTELEVELTMNPR